MHASTFFGLLAGIAAGLRIAAGQVRVHHAQGASWTLREQVRFDRSRTDNWDSYPILRFTDVPAVTVRIIDAHREPEAGAGEVA